MAVPLFAGNIIDAVLNEGMDILTFYSILLAIIFIVASFFGFVRAALFTIAGERVVATLRKDVFNAILRQEVGFFDVNRTGDLINRLSSDCTVIQNTVTVNISQGTRSLLSAIGGFVILFTISPKLCLVIIALIPLILIAAFIYGKYVQKLSKEVQDALAESSTIAEEALGCIRTVRAFSNEHGEKGKYKEKVQNSFKLAKKRAILSGIFSAATGLVFNIAIPVILYIGGSLTVSGEITPGQLTSFIMYTISVGVSISILSGLYGDFMKAVGASERIFGIMDRVPEVIFEGGTVPETISGLVEFKQVNFHYPSRPEKQILKGMNLTLEPGTIVALVGPSGGGKSTIANLIEQFYYPTSGSVFLDSLDLKTIDPQHYHGDEIGIVSQEPNLFGLSIADNIAYGVKDGYFDSDIKRGRAIVKAAKMANAHEFIKSFSQGYDTLVGERGVRLSGGQKQRIAIARALIRNPKILILDEATSALDSESEFMVQQAIDDLLKRTEDKTVLVIAHRLSTVRDANKVCVIENGRVVEEGTHDDLVNSDTLYKQLVKRQLGLS